MTDFDKELCLNLLKEFYDFQLLEFNKWNIREDECPKVCDSMQDTTYMISVLQKEINSDH